MFAVRTPAGFACVKINYKGFEISLSFDDSYAEDTTQIMRRSYLRIYDNLGTSVTEELMGAYDMYALSGKDLRNVFQIIDVHESKKAAAVLANRTKWPRVYLFGQLLVAAFHLPFSKHDVVQKALLKLWGTQ